MKANWAGYEGKRAQTCYVTCRVPVPAGSAKVKVFPHQEMRLERVGCECVTCSSKIIWFTNNWSCNHPSCRNASHQRSLGYADESSHTKISTRDNKYTTFYTWLVSQFDIREVPNSEKTAFLAASTSLTLTGSCHFKWCSGVETELRGVWNRERPPLTTAGYNFSVTQMSGSDLVTGGFSAMKHGWRPGLFSEIYKKQRSSAGISIKNRQTWFISSWAKSIRCGISAVWRSDLHRWQEQTPTLFFPFFFTK